MNIEEKRYDVIDALRGIAIFLVILGHSIIIYPINLHNIIWCKFIYQLVNSIHMPLFFIISGFCFKFDIYNFSFEYKVLLKKKLRRLIIPYLTFSFLDMSISFLFPNMVSNEENSIIKRITIIFFYGGEYWFLYVLFGIILIFPIILKFSYISIQIRTIVYGLIIILSLAHNILPNILAIDSMAYYLLFFSLGYRISRWYVQSKHKIENLYKIRLILIVGLCWFCLEFMVFFNIIKEGTIINILSAILGMIELTFILLHSKKIKNFFKKYSFYSLQLYLLNAYFLVVSRTIVCNILGLTQAILIIFINVFVSFFISYLFIKFLVRKNKFLSLICGV